MMKKIIYGVLCMLLFGACDNYLDIKPKGIKEPSSVEDMHRIMTKLYYTTENTFLMGDDIFKPEVLAENFSLLFHNYNAYSWGEYLFPKDGRDTDWEESYANLYRFNTVIERIDNASGDDELRKQVKGDALFNRAYAYFKLVNQYAKQYNVETASTDLGVPLRLIADVNAVNTRATVAEVYEQMIADLEVAIELLSVEKDHNFRPNKVAANILLAKVYLHMRNFELARKYAGNALKNDNSLFDYQTIDDAKKFPTPQEHPEYPFYTWKRQKVDLSPKVYDGIDGTYFSPELLALYDANDLRVKLWQRLTNEHGVIFNYRHAMEYRHQGLCIPDAYLIRAECNARLGEKDAAMDDVNAIRVKRFKTEEYSALTATDATDALNKVLDERRREMAFLNDRWYDMRRLDVDPVYQRTYTRTLGGKTFTLEINSNRFVVAIPRNVIDINGIEQNPR